LLLFSHVKGFPRVKYCVYYACLFYVVLLIFHCIFIYIYYLFFGYNAYAYGWYFQCVIMLWWVWFIIRHVIIKEVINYYESKKTSTHISLRKLNMLYKTLQPNVQVHVGFLFLEHFFYFGFYFYSCLISTCLLMQMIFSPCKFILSLF
jgi:hypothetical protein